MAKKQVSTLVKVSEINAYGDGCHNGYRLAQEWLNSGKRGMSGGSLQMIVLDLAERLSDARDDKIKRQRVHGEIVGFCFALECPEEAAQIERHNAQRRAKKDTSFRRIARAVSGSTGGVAA